MPPLEHIETIEKRLWGAIDEWRNDIFCARRLPYAFTIAWLKSICLRMVTVGMRVLLQMRYCKKSYMNNRSIGTMAIYKTLVNIVANISRH